MILENVVRTGYIKAGNYYRHGIFSADYVLELYKKGKSPDKKCSIHGKRLQTFFQKGFECVRCGVKGIFFAVESHRGDTYKSNKNDIPRHLNLYAIKKDGKEVLMTSDHIRPKSKGGSDLLDNRQPMCSPCNLRKGNGYEEKDGGVMKPVYYSKMYAITSREALQKFGGNRGKIAAQAGHAYLHAFWDAQEKFPAIAKAYQQSGSATKICLVVETDDELRNIYESFKDSFGSTMVIDKGLTVFKEPTLTFVGLGPVIESETPQVISSAKVLI